MSTEGDDELRRIRQALEKSNELRNTGCGAIAAGFLFGIGLLLALAMFHNCGGRLTP